jgi:hypothetical protein
MREWEAEEVLYAMKQAGFESTFTIAAVTGHDVAEVEALLETLGIGGTLLAPELRRCSVCGAYRTAVSKQGVCRPCTIRSKLDAAERAIAEESGTRQAREHIRSVFNGSSSDRSTAKNPMSQRPKPPTVPKDAPLKEQKAARAAYAAALEDWEAKELTRAYNVARKRLQRCREANGTNPVKGKREAE